MIDRSISRVILSIAALLICTFPALAGLQRVVSTTVVVIRAAGPQGVALDCADGACASGPVAKAIASALKNPNITIAGLFDEVNKSVAASTAREEVPTITASEPIDVPLHQGAGTASALVIGNGAYVHFARLQGSPRDADLVGKSLSGIGFRTKTVIDAETRVLKKQFDDFLAGLGPEDVAVLYYSGHGFALKGVEYLPAIDGETASADQLAASSISIDSLMDGLAQSKAAKKILILDAEFLDVHSPNDR